jgi:FlaA1/EpsC-like NDP-sugar epimerase
MVKTLIFKSNTPRWAIFLIDIAIVSFAIFMAYMLRFNFKVPATELPLIKFAVAAIIGIRAIGFLIGKPYAMYIRYTNTDDAKKILIICFIGSIFIALSNGISFATNEIYVIPFSIVILEFLLTSFIMISSRAFFKLMYDNFSNPSSEKTPVLIFGAGEAGVIAKRTIDRDIKSNFSVVGFVDDNEAKSKRKLENKTIFKGKLLAKILEEKDISHLIISTANISKPRLNKIITTCLNHLVQVLNVPPASKWINGELSVKQIRQVKIEDLLGREPIQLSENKIKSQLKGKVVLITGAAGSIGSEIVRQAIQYGPQKLILVDQAESDLYELEMELAANKQADCLDIVIGDICNEKRMRSLFNRTKPEIIFHAAAYKHVPLMENNPTEAIYTNILGSKQIAKLADEFGVKTFVMVSTDKAVNPTNVMGASKRVAEIYTQALNEHSKTNYITTRFGNVLGSNGSVIPLFKKQIERGGPLTVTHPDITRYFMTIPEACQLVLEAGSSGKGGEIYIFDMGESVKIKDLASQMIKLSGLEEGIDIQVVYTGLRPGEKLYEELLNDQENTLSTHHPQIMIAKVAKYGLEQVNEKISLLEKGVNDNCETELVKVLKDLVPEYKSNNSVYQKLDEAKAV